MASVHDRINDVKNSDDDLKSDLLNELDSITTELSSIDDAAKDGATMALTLFENLEEALSTPYLEKITEIKNLFEEIAGRVY